MAYTTQVKYLPHSTRRLSEGTLLFPGAGRRACRVSKNKSVRWSRSRSTECACKTDLPVSESPEDDSKFAQRRRGQLILAFTCTHTRRHSISPSRKSDLQAWCPAFIHRLWLRTPSQRFPFGSLLACMLEIGPSALHQVVIDLSQAK